MPTFGKIKESARQNQCLANIRQMQQANILYAQDNDGRFVPAQYYPPDSAVRTPWWKNSDYLSYLNAKSYVPKRQGCPDGILTTGPGLYTGGYGYNVSGPGGYFDAAVSTGIRQTQIARPASSIAFIDGLDWMVTWAGAGKYVGNEDYIPAACAFRHGGKANVVFWDGHAVSIPRESVVSNKELWSVTQ